MDGPSDHSANMRSALERMVDRRAAILEMLRTTGPATTSEVAVWIDTHTDQALKDLHAMARAEKVTSTRVERHGSPAYLWSIAENRP